MNQSAMKLVLVLSGLLALFVCSAAQTCRSQRYANRLYAACNDLPHLNSFLHWTYHPANGTADIAYRAPMGDSGWIAYAINRNRTGMVGAETLMGVRLANGTTYPYTTRITSYRPAMTPEPLSFDVQGLTVDVSGGAMTIFAHIQLPGNRTTISHVWQEGPTSPSFGIHSLDDAHKSSLGTLDLLSGAGSDSGAVVPRLGRKNIHGVLSAVSWGTLMPMGVIIARYMKVFKSADPAWFYLHVTCQCSAYIIGVAGWGTGLKLGADSSGITYSTHRNMGISLFVLATLQVFALLLRPQKDHKYRLYWNVYHHSVGCAVIVLSVINVYQGLDILDPERKWKNAYTGVIIALGVVAVVLEAVTWPIVIKRKRSEKSHHAGNGYTNGV